VPADKLIYVRLANGVELRHAIYLAKNWENDGIIFPLKEKLFFIN